MLDGDDDAIHSSTIAQQPQVWTIYEHHHPIPNTMDTTASVSMKRSGSCDSHHSLTTGPVAVGPSLHGHLPRGIEIKEHLPMDLPKPSRSRQLAQTSSSGPPSLLSRKIVATYIDPSSGVTKHTSYTTWTDPQQANDTLPSDPAHSVSPSERRGLRTLHAVARSISMREKPYSGNYADPYGFSSPHTPQNLSGPPSRSSPEPQRASEIKLVTTLDDSPQDIILTGKVCGSENPSALVHFAHV